MSQAISQLCILSQRYLDVAGLVSGSIWVETTFAGTYSLNARMSLPSCSSNFSEISQLNSNRLFKDPTGVITIIESTNEEERWLFHFLSWRQEISLSLFQAVWPWVIWEIETKSTAQLVFSADNELWVTQSLLHSNFLISSTVSGHWRNWLNRLLKVSWLTFRSWSP